MDRSNDGLDDLFVSDIESDEEILDKENEVLKTKALKNDIYAKPDTKYVEKSKGEMICVDCKGKVLDADTFYPEMQQYHQYFFYDDCSYGF